MSRHTRLFRRLTPVAALFAALPVQAQRVDVYGRELTPQSRHVPLAPAVASPAADANGGFTLLPFETRQTDNDADSVAIGDVTGDGRVDIVLATTRGFGGPNENHVCVFAQDTSGALLPQQRTTYHQYSTVTGIALGNFNGAGARDVAIGANRMTVLYAAAQSPWLQLGGFLGTTSASLMTTLDLDGIGRDDLVTVTWDTGVRHVADRFAGYGTVPWGLPGGGYALAKGDLDGDGIDDLAVASAQFATGWPGGIHALRNHYDGNLSEIGHIADAYVTALAIGDVDNDGIADIVASAGGNSPGSRLLVYRGTGGGQFDAAIVLPSYDIPESLAVADMNLDGRDDVLVLHGGWTELGVYLQRADGTLAPERLFPIPYASTYNAQGIAVADFSGDGCPDVAIADYNYGLVTLRGTRCDTLFADRFE